jgi:LAS superfamily LD-carboxypeptidase LdcB
MALFRTPGPLCQVKNWFEDPLDGDTLMRMRHNAPGPVGVVAGRIPYEQRIDPGIETLEKIDKYAMPYLLAAQGRIFRLELRTAQSLRSLRTAALAAGFDSELFTLTSDYRSSDKQARLASEARKSYGGRQQAGVFVAQGRSEHITGRAMDLHLGISNSGANALARKFDALPQYLWLKQNAARFGLNPYPYADAKHPGEPWHWSFNIR